MQQINFFVTFLLAAATSVFAQITSSQLKTFPNSLELPAKFDPIIAAYWTGLPHHRRTPFAVSPDGKSGYLAFLASPSYASVYVQKVNIADFTKDGEAVEITGAREAGGLVAQNDGFAILVSLDSGDSNVPFPVATIIRYKNGAQAWKTPVNGPGVHESAGLSSSPDMNGDLVYSKSAGLYAAYFVVASYSGSASGHYGDSIQYVDDSGARKEITGASSTFGCSHNTGIAIEAADETPFASVCAEDHGGIWLNTKTQYMAGIKIANENTTNGVSGEPMGGMSGSYSNLARFGTSAEYIFAWQSRGAVNLKQDQWMGEGYTQSDPRWLNHNVAISLLASKSSLAGQQAVSKVGASEGDSQVTWITKSAEEDHQNVRVAAFNDKLAMVSWETLGSPDCKPVPLSCTGTFKGTSLQMVNKSGEKVGDALVVDDVYVAGDIVNVGNGKLCWPYVQMMWDLSAPKANGTYTEKVSFACVTDSSVNTASVSASASASASAKNNFEFASTSASNPTTTSPVKASSGGANAVTRVSASTKPDAGTSTYAVDATRSFDFPATTSTPASSQAVAPSASPSKPTAVPTTSSSAQAPPAETTQLSTTYVTKTTETVETVTETAYAAPSPTVPSNANSEPKTPSTPSASAGTNYPASCSSASECGPGMKCVVFRWGNGYKSTSKDATKSGVCLSVPSAAAKSGVWSFRD